MRLRTLAILGASCAALGSASLASAQTTQRVYQTTPGTVVVVDDERAPDYRMEESNARYRNPIRPRFGLDGTGGAFVRGPEAAFGGLRARLGLQLGDWFSIYYMPTGLVGGFLSSRANDAVVGLMYNTLMAEVTLFDMVQLGVGPSIDLTWGCADDRQGDLSCADHGPFFGLDGRVAVVIGGDMEHGRGGLTLSADVHPTWYNDDAVGITVLGGIGVDMY